MDLCVLPWNSRIPPLWVMLSESHLLGRKQHSVVCDQFTQMIIDHADCDTEFKKGKLCAKQLQLLEFLKCCFRKLLLACVMCDICSLKLVSSKRTTGCQNHLTTTEFGDVSRSVAAAAHIVS